MVTPNGRRIASLVVVGVLVLPFAAACTPFNGSQAAPTGAPATHKTQETQETQETVATPVCDETLPDVARPGHNATRRDVSSIQALVGATVDGAYGLDTTARVILWQRCHGLEADGVWGPKSDALAFGGASTAEASVARVWRCRDVTSFDKNAYNDNRCTDGNESRLVSDSQARRLDPTYVPGQSGDPWYNSQ